MKTPKMLLSISGKPMVLYVIELAKALNMEKIVVVLGHQGEKIKKVIRRTQREPVK